MSPPDIHAAALAVSGAAVGAVLGDPAARLARRYDPQRVWPSAALAASLLSLAFGWAALARPAGADSTFYLITSAWLGAALTTLALIDARVHRLPDLLTLPLLATGLAIGLMGRGPLLLDRAAGAAGAWLAVTLLAWGFRRTRGREGLGPGDAKLMAAAGAWLGWRALPWTLLLACGFAFVWIAVRLARGDREALARPLAFGAPLAMAIWWVWLYGAPIG